MTTIAQQLDNVLALVGGMPCRCMSVAQLGERDPGCDKCEATEKLEAIRAAVGGEAVVFGHYFRDASGNQHFHTGATVPPFAQSDITPLYASPTATETNEQAADWPTEAKRASGDGDNWEARTATTLHLMGEIQAFTWNACRAACIAAHKRATPATVDVGAIVAAFDRAMKASWKMVNAYESSAPGSYFRGMNTGMSAALRTVRENYERELAELIGKEA